MSRKVVRPTLLALLLVIVVLLPTLIIDPSSFPGEPTPQQPLDSGLTTPMPTPTPQPTPILTVNGPAPAVNATAAYIVDNHTDHVLLDLNGETPLPMASTTKIMTALIALQSNDLNQPIPVTQDAVDHVVIDGGSSAGLVVGDVLSLKDMLYALLLPSGDDAAFAIADALGGQANFIQRMNIFAYRLHLFQTHFSNVDGLTLDDQPHYTSASDLVRLAQHAMQNPLFAKIVRTPAYWIPATAQHNAYAWQTTNLLLLNYKGMIGIKTGHTDAAGWCLVFDVQQKQQDLIGVILGSPDEPQRDQDVVTLLNWAFALPLLPPT